MNQVKVLLADAQYLSRAGFRQLFNEQAYIAVVGEAASPEELHELVRQEAPDIVVFDYFDSDCYSIEDIQKVRQEHPNTRFLVVTADKDPGSIFRILEFGVNSILTKNCSKEEITNGVLATARKEKFFCNKILEIILERQLGGEEKEANCAPSTLTARELEVVELIASGVSTKDMAEQLCLSPHTIYTHRKNIMKKLGINSVSELVLYAVNAGIVKSALN